MALTITSQMGQLTNIAHIMLLT